MESVPSELMDLVLQLVTMNYISGSEYTINGLCLITKLLIIVSLLSFLACEWVYTLQQEFRSPYLLNLYVAFKLRVIAQPPGMQIRKLPFFVFFHLASIRNLGYFSAGGGLLFSLSCVVGALLVWPTASASVDALADVFLPVVTEPSTRCFLLTHVTPIVPYQFRHCWVQSLSWSLIYARLTEASVVVVCAVIWGRIRKFHSRTTNPLLKKIYQDAIVYSCGNCCPSIIVIPLR
ncbi:hypothetical protein P691DRAFT_790906, partial [Macrolepiota fuliginosa MF-IS2]